MRLDRRGILCGLLAGGMSCALRSPTWAATDAGLTAAPQMKWHHFELPNGLRLHIWPNKTEYVSASLLLRARQIASGDGGLAHLMEHTSFTGGAGHLSAAQLKGLHKDILLQSNASTSVGAIEWQVSFLPQDLQQALDILAVTSLDQKFDEETVASEAKIVLQELYLDKHDVTRMHEKRVARALFGSEHPYAQDTVDEEIATAMSPPVRLAEQLRHYAAGLKLPANIDFFLAGGIDAAATESAARSAFGNYRHAKAAMSEFPRVAVTRNHERMNGPARKLARPMCEVEITWNTGVCIQDRDARTLMALREYLDSVLSLHLREKYGEAYTPEIKYDPDMCSGVFTVSVTSSVSPVKVESSVFEAFNLAKQSVDPREVARFAGRVKLARLKAEDDNERLVDQMVQSTIDGGAPDALEIEGVTPDEILMAAKRYLPDQGGGYVCVALRGE